MKRVSYIILLLLSLSLLSCEKQLDIADDGSHQLVLNGLPLAGNRAFVNFAYTRFFLDQNNDHPVDGVSMVLKVNGVPMWPDSVSHCNYFFPYVLQPDDSLSIDITAGSHNVHAETYVPLVPAVDTIKVRHFASSSFNFLMADFRLDDHGDRDEYYRIVVNERDSGVRYNDWTRTYDTVDSTFTTYFLVPYNEDITSNDVCPYIPLGGYLYSSLMFTDRRIAGQQYPVHLYIMQLVDTNEVQPFKHEYTVDISSVTPARFRYILSASTQNSMTSVFAEQGQAFSNVKVDGETGLGIFAGMSRRRFTFDPDTIP